MTGPFFDLVEKYKPQMVDLDLETFNPTNYKFNTVQLKLDGWFSIVRILDHKAQVITSGGEIRKEFTIRKIKNAILLCEWIYGTNWSKKSLYEGFLVAHDIIMLDDNYFMSHNYWSRYQKLDYIQEVFRDQGFLFGVFGSFPISDWKDLWENRVVSEGFEGLVFKNDLDTWPMHMGRMKPVVEEDYVVIGFKEGNNRLTGTLGAIEGGMYVNGKLTRICTVGGGFTDSMRDDIWNRQDYFMGKVFTARGKMRFDSGALRHPNFWEWRDDKDPELCRWPKKLE